jgi:hypothetical protein
MHVKGEHRHQGGDEVDAADDLRGVDFPTPRQIV